MNVGSVVSGLADAGSVLYNHYYGSKNKSLGAQVPNMKNIGHYNKSGKRLGIYHKSI